MTEMFGLFLPILFGVGMVYVTHILVAVFMGFAFVAEESASDGS